MKIIGVTGGVGAGKSEILHYIETHYNARVLLADEAAHAIEAPGGAIYEPLIQLLDRYLVPVTDGAEAAPITLPDGMINKPEMARRIFSVPELLEQVNQLVHPAVKTYILDESAREKKAGRLDFFIVEAALLIEAGYKEHLDELWYIYCDENERRRRLRASRGYSDEKIDNILRSQLSEQEFRDNADVVIDNSGTIEAACAQVDAALSRG
ncbi:MAG: dephospho-CoA kinase [Lachnospiraceae bacterium]|nr:dephospho-CoA kinase [Lachnospiraceae bacterium]